MESKSNVAIIVGLIFGHASGAQATQLPIQVLKAFYEASSQPASYEDIDAYGTSAQACITSTVNSPENTYPIAIARFDSIVVPGAPPQGPLFPGTPDRVIPHCLVWTRAAHINDSEVLGICKSQTTEANGTDFRVGYNTSAYAERLETFSFRKNGESVSFKSEVQVYDLQTGNPTWVTGAYGYCYRR